MTTVRVTPAVPIHLDELLRPHRELRAAAVAVGTMLVALVVFGLFIHLPIAAVAPGKIVAEGFRKPVQHLEGGIVREILVVEGQSVAAGAPLLRLENTQSRAEAVTLEQRYVYLAALAERLSAEETRARSLRFAPALLERAARTGAQHVLEAQAELFRGRRRSLDERLASLDAELAQLDRQSSALAAQAASVRRQIDLSREELADYRRLFDQGFGLKVKVLELERRIEALNAAESESGSDRAQVEARIKQLGLDRSRTLEEYVDAAALKRTEISPDLVAVAQRLEVLDDVLTRGELRAPIAGTVYDLKKLSPGSVIGRGDTVLEIVPAHAELIAEVQVDPSDIENVRIGDAAFVKVFSRVRGQAVEVDGAVLMVSSDRFEDRATHRPYYAVHVSLKPEPGDARLSELRPGMSAEAYILTGKRTPLGMLLQPLVDSFTRASRER
jgi:HlyD family type I secretion membrane fusion protein